VAPAGYGYRYSGIRHVGAGVPDFAAENVCKTPLVGGQWRQEDDGSFELVVVDNTTAPDIPAAGTMQPLS
jgi:branched-chain amino acid transport system substrate-binding protein